MHSGVCAAYPVLSVNNLEVVYDDVIQVLSGVSLTVPEGKIVALLGAGVGVAIAWIAALAIGAAQ